jgi:hypothetical protein
VSRIDFYSPLGCGTYREPGWFPCDRVAVSRLILFCLPGIRRGISDGFFWRFHAKSKLNWQTIIFPRVRYIIIDAFIFNQGKAICFYIMKVQQQTHQKFVEEVHNK